jgi:hypothetical protein
MKVSSIVLRKNLRGERFQLIVMMQAAETCAGNDATSVSQAMSGQDRLTR